MGTRLSQCARYDRVRPGVPGSLDRHGKPNTQRLDEEISSLTQGSSPGKTLVDVERCDGEPLQVEASRAPLIVWT